MPLVAVFAALLLSACAWETYETAEGKTALRQKYPTGTPVVYQDGTYSQNMRYNQLRPEPIALDSKAQTAEPAVRGINWQNQTESK
ncbi:MAG: spore cortex protein [Neisseria sp.]|nr:spore cortex protein [Neisseria sp.]